MAAFLFVSLLCYLPYSDTELNLSFFYTVH